MPTQKKPRAVEFHHEFAPDYKLHPVNGVWAGITPRGDVRIDFFVETYFVPTKVVSELTPDDRLGREIERILPTGQTEEGRVSFKREIKCGILLSREHAINLAELIREKLGEATREDKSSGKVQ